MFLYPSSIIPCRQPQTLWQKFKTLPNIFVVTTLAPAIGIGAGIGAIAITWIVGILHKVLFEDKLWGLLEFFGPFYLIIIPAIGGLIVGFIIFHFAYQTKGRSVPETLKAVAVHNEDIPPQSLVVKSLTSALCVGTGGSVGLGGPTGQLGAAFGAAVGQLLTLSKDQTRLLFTCGIGAGIAAAFHAPIMGTVFAIEVILGRFTISSFTAVIISAMTADGITRLYTGGNFLVLEQYTMVSYWELLLYAVLGVVVAIGAKGFTTIMSSMKKFWIMMPVSDYVKPMLGGIVLGLVGLITFQLDGIPRIFGLGSSSLSEALNGSLALHVIFALFLLKMFTTSLTLGSGGVGGTFTPSFFMGATLGGAFGYFASMLFPTITSPSAAYAMAGMAAFVGGAFNAPLTALLVGFEIIGHYQIIWPIMLTILVSTLVSKIMAPQYRAGIYSSLMNGKRTYILLQLLRFPKSTLKGEISFILQQIKFRGAYF
jgi:CIC family chloride channel protein